MKLETFTEKCIYITMIIFVFTLIFNFVMGLGVFTNVNTPSGLQIEGTTEEKLQQVTMSAEYSDGIVMDNIWSVVLFGSVTGVAIAILTQNTSIIAVYIFCYVFWSMYLNLMSMLSTAGFLSGQLLAFVGIGTALVSIAFIGAVIGMLSGSS